MDCVGATLDTLYNYKKFRELILPKLYSFCEVSFIAASEEVKSINLHEYELKH